MSSITTAVAVDYRLQQWAQLVKDCQNRPQDMTVEQWCDTKGISKSNYYYRLRCIRKACLEHVQDNSVSCQQVVEIPEKITQQSRSESPSDISIRLLLAGGYRLRTYRLLMSTQKQLFIQKKELLINSQKLRLFFSIFIHLFSIKHIFLLFIF